MRYHVEKICLIGCSNDDDQGREMTLESFQYCSTVVFCRVALRKINCARINLINADEMLYVSANVNVICVRYLWTDVTLLTQNTRFTIMKEFEKEKSL